MSWGHLRRFFGLGPESPAKNVEDAVALHANSKAQSDQWFEVKLYAHKQNPITEYRVELTPIANPPPPP